MNPDLVPVCYVRRRSNENWDYNGVCLRGAISHEEMSEKVSLSKSDLHRLRNNYSICFFQLEDMIDTK